MELVYTVLSIISLGLAAMGVTGCMFVLTNRLTGFLRALVASLIAVLISYGPGAYFNFTEIGDSTEFEIFLYFMISVMSAFPFAWLLSWMLDRDRLTKAGDDT